MRGQAVKNKGDFPVRIQGVNCFGGCHHPCAIGLSQAGKITYIYGNIPVRAADLDQTIAQIRTYAEHYTKSKIGYIPPADKPNLFKNVLMRIPDSNWESSTGIVTEHTAHTADEITPENAILKQADE